MYILCSNYVYLFKCILDICNRDFCFVFKFFIDGICVVALAPVARTISGAMFHPLDMMLLMSG